MKKIISLLLAMIMVFSLAAAVSAEVANKDAAYKKNYTATNADSVNPAETFTITYTNGVAIDPSTGEALVNLATNEAVTAPVIPVSTVSYTEGELTATTAGNAVEKEITVALANITWPYVGVYTYDVTETEGNTAGVEYDTEVRKLKVTVAYDEGTDTYYTAFVSLTLTDADEDGITDGEKTDVFENVYNAGKLTVKKNVTGNLGDQQKVFNVYVTFTVPDDVTVGAPITYVDGTETKSIPAADLADKTETVTITLIHDESVVFENIPYGVTYAVEEENYTDEGYDEAEYDNNKTNVMGEVSYETVITNNKETAVDTGIALDSAPYFVILAVAMFGMVALVSKKRYEV